MSIEDDIARLALQERRLHLARFDHAQAWELGSKLRAAAEARGVALTIEIRVAKESVFFSAMSGTTPSNADWARRKRNTSELLQCSSYAAGRSLELEGITLEQKMGAPLRDFAIHGGAFPLRVQGAGAIGTVTVSGAPEREDHEIIVAALADMCGVAIDEVQLD